MSSQVQSLPGAIQAAFQEVEDKLNFRMFTLIGGPAANGGSLSVMKVQTGCSRGKRMDMDGSFETYLGDLYPVLKQKWIQWLATTYCKLNISHDTPALTTLRSAGQISPC